jgi:hypothetical protein
MRAVENHEMNHCDPEERIVCAVCWQNVFKSAKWWDTYTQSLHGKAVFVSCVIIQELIFLPRLWWQ